EPAKVPLLLLEMRLADLQPWREEETGGFRALRHAEAGSRDARLVSRVRRLESRMGRSVRRAAAIRGVPDRIAQRTAAFLMRQNLRLAVLAVAAMAAGCGGTTRIVALGSDRY